ncbi:MAG: NIPSNAP family protein [Rhodospirillales bacterium]|nr:NIPSNAP family protein [Rhodospirillales bacterium]
MIVDFRTYTLRLGKLPTYLDLYGREGWPIQTGHLGNCLGYYIVDIGVQSRVVHLWGYDDAGERERRRAAMEGDPAWTAYRAKTTAFFEAQENRILKPAPFWPVKKPTESRGGGPFSCVDLHIYTLNPGKLGEFFKLYAAEGRAVHIGHLGHCIGYYQSETGIQHQIVHLWGYKDIADRAKRRVALGEDPAWNAYTEKADSLLAAMENWILRPAPFWTPA